MGNLKYKFLILVTLCSTLSWAAPPRVSSDPETNCNSLLTYGRQVSLPGARGFFKNAVRPPKEMKFLTHNLRDFFSMSHKYRRYGINDPDARAQFAEWVSRRSKSRDDLLAHARIIKEE